MCQSEKGSRPRKGVEARRILEFTLGVLNSTEIVYSKAVSSTQRFGGLSPDPVTSVMNTELQQFVGNRRCYFVSRPADKLKTVPKPSVPPVYVVP
jgi:hypothetical protein